MSDEEEPRLKLWQRVRLGSALQRLPLPWMRGQSNACCSSPAEAAQRSLASSWRERDVEEERLQHEARWFASLASYGKRNRNDLRDAMMMTRVPRNALSSSGLPDCAAREGPVANALVMFGSSCSALSNRASPKHQRGGNKNKNFNTRCPTFLLSI